MKFENLLLDRGFIVIDAMSCSIRIVSRPLLRQSNVLTQRCSPIKRSFQTTSIITSIQQQQHQAQAQPPFGLAWQVPPNQGERSNSGFFTPSPIPERSKDSSSQNNNNDKEINDHEFQLRVGRAYDLLRATIPDFMRIGLVDYDQYSSHDKQSSSKMSLLDALMFRNLRERANEDGLLGSFTGMKPNGEKKSILMDLASSEDQQIYHSNISFRFCPEASLSDEEAASLSFTGRSLYFASAHVLRHTLNVLFTNTQVSIASIRREKKSAHSREDVNNSSTSTSREETIYLRVEFLGHLRVTGAEHRYTLIFRYEFDPKSGKIISHTVERIEPAIGRKLWFGLASVWQRITGQSQQEQHPVPTAIHAHCSSPTEMTRNRIDRIRNRKIN